MVCTALHGVACTSMMHLFTLWPMEFGSQPYHCYNDACLKRSVLYVETTKQRYYLKTNSVVLQDGLSQTSPILNYKPQYALALHSLACVVIKSSRPAVIDLLNPSCSKAFLCFKLSAMRQDQTKSFLVVYSKSCPFLKQPRHHSARSAHE